MKIKKLSGLTNKLISLLNEHEDIFFNERKFLEKLTDDPEIAFYIEERQENELKIKKSVEALNKELVEKVLEQASKTKQERFL